MHRPTRRLRFCKPEGSDVNPLANNPPISEEPSAPAICVKASRKRWTDSISATRSSDAQSSSQQPSVATGTPISKGTPETLRTLELNWRDRRRAKLEDITLQRVMGVEKGGDLHAEITEGKTSKHVEVRSQPLADRPIKQSTRPEQEQPSEAIASSSRVGRRINGQQTQAAPSSSNMNSPAEVRRRRSTPNVPFTDITTAATANNTTHQTGAHKARKIVKLARDARLSVQGNEKRASTTVTPAVKAHPSRRNLAEPLDNTLNPALALPSNLASCLPSSLPLSTKRSPVIAQGTATPRRVSILREPSSQQKDDVKQSSSRQSTSFSIRSAVHDRRYTDSLYPISVTPLPAQEYPLSSTATLIVYPYEQDWSVIIPSQDGSQEGQAGSRKSRPVMSALTASERIDILDEGNTMRIKSRLKGSAKVKPSRYLRFGERDSWSEADRRRWTLSQILVDRLKRRTRKATYEFPQGTLHIMCNNPPDIVFYTNIVRPPFLQSNGREYTLPDYDPTCDTSALLTASTDMSGICRSRILCSPSRGILKLSTRSGLSSHRTGEYTHRPSNGSSHRYTETDSFRSRRIIHLPTSSHDSVTTLDHLERLYSEQKALVLQAPLSRNPADGNQVWQVYELQSLGRFLKLKDTWTERL